MIPAAGIGKRMQSDIPKQYLKLGERTILEHTIQCFLDEAKIHRIVVVIAEHDSYWSSLSIHNDRIITADGGAERCHSVLNGLTAIQDQADDNDWVLVHDAARPCLSRSELNRLISEVGDDDVGGILAVPVRDTMKRGTADNEIAETVDRNQLWHALTPQMFRFHKLLSSLRNIQKLQQIVTDEAEAIEKTGVKSQLVRGEYSNIKVTEMGDIELAIFYLQQQEKAR